VILSAFATFLHPRTFLLPTLRTASHTAGINSTTRPLTNPSHGSRCSSSRLLPHPLLPHPGTPTAR
jgi:hypothetical protein